MSGITFDDSEFPLVRVTFEGDPSEGDFDRYLGDLQKNLDRCERLDRRSGVLLDASRSGPVSASMRKKQAEWTRTHFDRSARYVVGYAFVIHSPVVRGILTAILWLAPLPSPHTVTNTVREAEEWLRDRLAVAKMARAV